MATDRRRPRDLDRDARPRAVPDDAVECRLLREARPGAVLRGPRPGDDPPRHRPGGGRGRRSRAAMRADDYTFCTYRGHNHTLARGVPMAPILRRAVRAGERAPGRQGRLDAPHERRARRDGLVRDRRRAPADRAGRGVVGPVPQVRPGRGLLLRRRDDEHRRVPRGAEHGRGLEGAGRLRLREQPVHGVHADRRRDRRARGRPPTGRAPTGWSRSSSTATTPRRSTRSRRAAIDRARAGDGPSLDRGAHLPARRPLARRPRQVPPGRRGRGVEGARPDPGATGRGSRRPASTAAELDAIDAERASQGRRGRGRRRGPRPSRRRTSSRPRSGPTGLGMAELTYRGADRGRASPRRWSATRPSSSSARTSGRPAASSS